MGDRLPKEYCITPGTAKRLLDAHIVEAERLHNVRAPILGCVLNDVDYRRDSRYYSTYGKYGYYHHYYYGDDGDKKKKKA